MPAIPGGTAIGTVYVAAPDGLTANDPPSVPLNVSPGAGSAWTVGSPFGGVVCGPRSGMMTIVCPAITTPRPVWPITTGVRWWLVADALTVSPFTVHEISLLPSNVGRKAPLCVPGGRYAGGAGRGFA